MPDQAVQGTQGSERMRALATDIMFTEALRKRQTADVAPLNDEGSETPIYWVHSVTGQGSDPVKLSGFMGEGQPFYSIRMPGPERKPESVSSVEALATRYVDAVTARQPEGPLIVGGWSAGVSIALEMAQQLKQRDRDVRYLVAVDFAPRNAPTDEPALGIAGKLGKWIAKEYAKNPSLYSLSKVIAKKMLERASPEPPSFHPVDKLAHSIGYSETERDFIRKLYDSVERYVPQKYEGAVLLYMAKPIDNNPDNGLVQEHGRIIRVWERLACHLRISEFDGDHECMIKGNRIEAFAARLGQDIAPGKAIDPRMNHAASSIPQNLFSNSLVPIVSLRPPL